MLQSTFPQALVSLPGRQGPRRGPSEPSSEHRNAQHEGCPMCYEIRFQSLFKEGRALSFPCDREGHVDLDHVTERLRSNYLFARAMLGREFAMPVVLERALH
jgi:hypothetical protein